MRSSLRNIVALLLFCQLPQEALCQRLESGGSRERVLNPIDGPSGPFGPLGPPKKWGPKLPFEAFPSNKEKKEIEKLRKLVEKARFDRGVQRAWDRYQRALGERIVPMIPDEDALFVLTASKAVYQEIFPTEISVFRGEGFELVEDQRLSKYRESRRRFFSFWRARSAEIEINLHKRLRLGNAHAAAVRLGELKESYLRYIDEHERLNKLPPPVTRANESEQDFRVRLEREAKERQPALPSGRRYMERIPDPDRDWYRDDKQDLFTISEAGSNSSKQFRWRRDVPREDWPHPGLQEALSLVALSFSKGKAAPGDELFCRPDWSRIASTEVIEVPMSATDYEKWTELKPFIPWKAALENKEPQWPFADDPRVIERGDWMPEKMYDVYVRDVVTKEAVPEEWQRLAQISVAVRTNRGPRNRTGCIGDRLLIRGGPGYLASHWSFESFFPDHEAMRTAVRNFHSAIGPLREEIAKSMPAFDDTITNTVALVKSARLELGEESRRMEICRGVILEKEERHRLVIADIERRLKEKEPIDARLEHAKNSQAAAQADLREKTEWHDKMGEALKTVMDEVDAYSEKASNMKVPNPSDRDFLTQADSYLRVSERQSGLLERVSDARKEVAAAAKGRSASSEFYQRKVLETFSARDALEKITSEIMLAKSEEKLVADFLAAKRSEFERVSAEHRTDEAAADRVQAQLEVVYPTAGK